MKNNRGYTLIEIIIAISLIIVIGTISVVSIKKTEQKPNEEKEEYLEKIKLDTAVYFENNKNLEKFEDLIISGDFQIIRIGDLIAEGLLDENSYNPITGNKNVDSKNDCVKVILNEDLNIDIVYEELNDEELKCKSPEKRQIDIHIKNNNNDTNKIVLDNSYDIYINNGTNLSQKISNGNYIKENFIDPGAVLRDETGKEYGEIVGNFSFNETTKEATYTYSIDESNPYYDRVTQKSVTRVVTYEDNSGPIILEYGYAYPENSYLYFDFPSYSGYMDFWTMYYNASNNYSIFDNRDGYKSFNLEEYYDYYYLDAFDWASNWYMYDQIEISDSSGNKTEYNIEIYQYYNEPPYVWYDDSYSYFYDYEIYVSNYEIYPFYDYIYVYDWDSEYYSYYYYLYDDYGNYYDAWNTSYLSPGSYTLYINAYDEYNWTSVSYDIYIDYYYYYDPWYDDYYDDYYYDDYYYDDYYCGDACIIEQMQQNSEAWWGASPEEQERLHEENEWLAGQLSGDAYYTDDGYWYTDDGSYLYGDNYYDSYYDSYYDPYYDSYYDPYYDYGYYDYYDYGYYDYYDCCWY